MANVDLARWQFAFVTINHFFFVPITIGLAFLTALLQTAWYRGKRDEYLRLTRFFGTLLVINITIGVVTGLVQEFQFGMNWGAYSRLVGNIFGAPLAMEGLAAFFLESTFLGLWLFGWDKLPRLVHLLTIWVVSLVTLLAAAFIMAANSWMQHPVGYTMNKSHQPQLNDIWAVFTNPVFVWGYSKVLLASLVTGAAVMLAVSAWQLRHGGETEVFTRSARLALVVLVPAMLFTMLVGDELGVIEGRYQPMKIAAAEAQWTTCQPCSFSLFQIGGGNNDQTPTKIIAIPHLMSLLATNHWNGQVTGLNPLQSQYSKSYGSGYYVPNVFIQYWSMRAMAYLGVLVFLISVWGLWLIRRKKLATSQVFLWVAVWGAVLPFLMNTAGWLLTESGRQPWIVQGIMLTKNGISPTVSSTWIVISLVAFVLLYGTLGTVDLILMLKYSREQIPPPRAGADIAPPVPAIQYSGHDDPRPVLVHRHRVSVDRLFDPRGVRLRRRHAAQRGRPGRGRPPGRHQHDRAAVGRQRGLAGRGRGRHVRRVSRLVRDDVFGLLPRAGPAAGVPDRPRRVLRVPRQARRRALASHLGCLADRGQPAGPAADRRGPRRHAARTADQLQPELHRVILEPAPALRPADRGHPGIDLPAARRDFPVPEDPRHHARAFQAPGPPHRPIHRRRRRGFRHLDAPDVRPHLLPHPDRAARRARRHRRHLARLLPQRRFRLRRDHRHDGGLHHIDLHRPVPQRDDLQHQRGVQPHRAQHSVRTVLPQGDDRRRHHLPASGPRLPDLDLLRIPEAHQPAGFPAVTAAGQARDRNSTRLN